MMRFLVTAGPTREFIDAVRFISNPSTGRMGYAIAQAAAAADHRAVLVAGPTGLPDPPGVEVVRVTTAQEMYDAVMARLDGTDAFIAAAAPCDFRPGERQAGKIKKERAQLVLRLVPTPDALQEVGRRKGRRAVIGFALEVDNGRANAQDKLCRKNLDAVVLNSPAAFGARRATVTLLRADGCEEDFGGVTKEELARRLVALAEEIWKGRKP